jgi:hypothetical protein
MWLPAYMSMDRIMMANTSKEEEVDICMCTHECTNLNLDRFIQKHIFPHVGQVMKVLACLELQELEGESGNTKQVKGDKNRY